jgi:uncharacterized membrane protein
MKAIDQIRILLLILSGFVYYGMYYLLPTGSWGLAIITAVYAAISVILSLIFALVYYLLVRYKKEKILSISFWGMIGLLLPFPLSTFPSA